MSELRFEGRVVAITGAAQGMGREYAVLLAERGAKVLVNDIKGADETVALIKGRGGEAIENRRDVSDPDQTDGMVQDALDAWGRLDALISNAAIYGGALPDPQTTDRILGVHLLATINGVRSAMPVFRRQKYGRILNIGSGSMFGLPNVGIYAAGKGGVYGFTRSLAADLAADEDRDIKANLILPVAFRPGLMCVPDAALQAFIDTALTPANIAPLAALLVHPSCPAQGEAIQVGGGRHARIVLSTTEGWQAPDDAITPEGVLSHWDEVVANRDLREPSGSMSDVLARRGFPPYNTVDLAELSRAAKKARESDG